MSAPARVLILEDEPTLRASMARGIGRLPGIEVVEAGTMEEALRAIDAAPPRLVLSDIDLPDRSGIEILGELGRRGLRAPVVFISAYLSAYRSQVPPHADVELRGKPVSLEELRALVTARVGSRVEPEPAPFSAADYLQLACVGRHSVRIDVALATGTSGYITVSGGDVWSAVDARGSGEEAFGRLVLAPARTVECHTLRDDPGPRTIVAPWEGLLLDAARRQDEGEGAPTGPAEPAAAPTQAPAAEVPDAFDAAWARGAEALLARDFAAAVEAFREADRVRPGEGRVRFNLERLKDMGYGAGEE